MVALDILESLRIKSESFLSRALAVKNSTTPAKFLFSGQKRGVITKKAGEMFQRLFRQMRAYVRITLTAITD